MAGACIKKPQGADACDPARTWTSGARVTGERCPPEALPLSRAVWASFANRSKRTPWCYRGNSALLSACILVAEIAFAEASQLLGSLSLCAPRALSLSVPLSCVSPLGVARVGLLGSWAWSIASDFSDFFLSPASRSPTTSRRCLRSSSQWLTWCSGASLRTARLAEFGKAVNHEA